MSRPTKILVFFGIMCGMFLSSLEITVVGTAAPLIIKSLGGFESYSRIFSSYLLTSTVSMPFWGRIADHWGRKPVFLACMLIFLLGSLLCGTAQTFDQLILFRAIKGIGGGGVVPLAFTLIADIFEYKSRAKLQGYLASVWGISSLVGPFIGGALAENFGWRWIFFVNLIPGTIAIAIIYFALTEIHQTRPLKELKISLQSLLCSVIFASAFLIGLNDVQKHHPRSALLFLSIAFLCFVLFVFTEYTHEHTLVPKELFKSRVFNMTCVSGFLSSFLVIGLANYLPLLYQVGLHFSPTASGLVLVPFTISWLVFGIVSTRIMMTYSYRKLLFLGFVLTSVGLIWFLADFKNQNLTLLTITSIIMGAGMAFNYPIVLITAQYDVPKNIVGFATSAIFWVRNMGATIATTIMGMILARHFTMGLKHLPQQIRETSTVTALIANPDLLFQSETIAKLPDLPLVKDILIQAMFLVFVVMAVATVLNLPLIGWFPSANGPSRRQ